VMVSRVFFSVEVRTETGQVEKHSDLHADLKQAVGGSFEGGPIEVGYPSDLLGNRYAGPLDYQAFRTAAEGYYKSLVGSAGTGVHLRSSSNLRMRNNLFGRPHSVEFRVDGQG
jgi:hypothetical protein